MASHLTITTATSGVSTSKSFGTSPETADGPGDVFAALLDNNVSPPAEEPARTSAATADVALGDEVKLSLGFGGDEPGESADPEAIAAVVDATIPVQDTPEAAAALTDIAETLVDLKARLDAGEPIDPEMLRQLEAALTTLAAELDIDLDALPSLEDLTALITDIQPDDDSFAARLSAAFGPLAETLFSGTTTADAGADVEISNLLKSIGDKLAALLTALNNGELDADKLAQLELAKGDVDLEAALAKLTTPVVAVKPEATTPVLATPQLEITEPALTGKANTTTEAAPATDTDIDTPKDTAAVPDKTLPAQASAKAEEHAFAGTGNGDKGADPQDKKPTDLRNPVAAAAVEKQPEAQNAAPPVPAARADAVAAPRVVQAGYQTSQQQLNLPQLAFEVVRQVSEGNTRFQIRLDPPELGRIDVRLDIDKAGLVHARLMVEKSETLDLMQRDQRALERALQQAGLDGTKTNLEFSLKQNPFGQQGQHGNGRNPIFGGEVTPEADEAPAPTVNLYRGRLTASGVNIIA